MAIDSLRKRASIASLGLAFLGPSVVPDGSFVQADRQTIANSYYGILTTANPLKTIGGTSQIEAFASSAVLKVGRNLGASSQLEAYLSSGGIDVLLPKTIGAASQLEAFASSGTIDSGTQTPPSTGTSGGGGGGGRFFASPIDEKKSPQVFKIEQEIRVTKKQKAEVVRQQLKVDTDAFSQAANRRSAGILALLTEQLQKLEERKKLQLALEKQAREMEQTIVIEKRVKRNKLRRKRLKMISILLQ